MPVLERDHRPDRALRQILAVRHGSGRGRGGGNGLFSLLSLAVERLSWPGHPVARTRDPSVRGIYRHRPGGLAGSVVCGSFRLESRPLLLRHIRGDRGPVHDPFSKRHPARVGGRRRAGGSAGCRRPGAKVGRFGGAAHHPGQTHRLASYARLPGSQFCGYNLPGLDSDLHGREVQLQPDRGRAVTEPFISRWPAPSARLSAAGWPTGSRKPFSAGACWCRRLGFLPAPLSSRWSP